MKKRIEVFNLKNFELLQYIINLEIADFRTFDFGKCDSQAIA